MEWNFIIQKSDIPGVTVGCDHAYKQVKLEDRTRGGLKDITRNQNSRNQHYLAPPVLVKMQEQVMNKVLAFSTLRYLIDTNRSLYSEHKGKSKLLSVLKKIYWCNHFDLLIWNWLCCIWRIWYVTHITEDKADKNRCWFSNAVCLWVNKTNFCSTVIIAFHTYQKMSLKPGTQNKRCSKSNPQHYNITLSANILHQSMSQLLVRKKPNDPW